jgi:hypothetical protein
VKKILAVLFLSILIIPCFLFAADKTYIPHQVIELQDSLASKTWTIVQSHAQWSKSFSTNGYYTLWYNTGAGTTSLKITLQMKGAGNWVNVADTTITTSVDAFWNLSKRTLPIRQLARFRIEGLAGHAAGGTACKFTYDGVY